MGTRTPILYLAPWVDLGGSDKGTIDWFRHIDHERWAPSLITTQPSRNGWLHLVEPHAEEVWALPDLLPGSSFPGMILGFIESRGVEVVHIMNARIAYDLLPDMACLARPPAVVVQFHAEEPERQGYVRYAAARYGNLVDGFSVTSRQLGAAMRDYDVAGSRIHVIYTGVDAAEEFNPDRVQPFADLRGSGPRVLWPGRLADQKDPMLTLDVLRRLKDRGVGLTLHVVGDGPLEPAVRRRAAELGVDAMIDWNPPSLEMARWYRSCDLLLMTSVFEGVPYVIYEALAMEVPVVAPALPGNVELMDEHAGILVDPRDDADGYARAIELLLGDEQRRREMGARARRRMLDDFSLREMAAQHEALYDDLLASRPAGRRGEPAPAPAPAELPPVRLERTPPPAPTVAVIVPCYQHGRYLADCIGSIRAQTLPPSQVIVVDDHSDDPETDAALDRIERDGDATVIRQERNLGPSAARNRALREVTASYVLPLDADDMLLPDALERMVAQLAAAPPDVAFVYPNPLHFGNRHDYVESPAYNLHLLLRDNYCAATSLFDRRAFDAGVAYAEDIVFGHEDWDLVLQLAERGLWGEVADGPTFKYRRRGFSRVNAVEYGPRSFHEEVERRHPALYAPAARREVKRRWAPALTIVLADAAGRRWTEEDLAPLARQSCRDFEVLTRRDLGPEATVVPGVGANDPEAAWAAAGIAAARGRWVLMAEPDAAAAFARPQFAELLLRCLYEMGAWAVGFVGLPDERRPAFSQAADHRDAPPAMLGWRRAALRGDPEVEAELGVTGSIVEDLLLSMQPWGEIQWRTLPVPAARPAAARVLEESGAAW